MKLNSFREIHSTLKMTSNVYMVQAARRSIQMFPKLFILMGKSERIVPKNRFVSYKN